MVPVPGAIGHHGHPAPAPPCTLAWIFAVWLAAGRPPARSRTADSDTGGARQTRSIGSIIIYIRRNSMAHGSFEIGGLFLHCAKRKSAAYSATNRTIVILFGDNMDISIVGIFAKMMSGIVRHSARGDANPKSKAEAR
jgi:hypothetical protein